MVASRQANTHAICRQQQSVIFVTPLLPGQEQALTITQSPVFVLVAITAASLKVKIRSICRLTVNATFATALEHGLAQPSITMLLPGYVQVVIMGLLPPARTLLILSPR